MRKPTIWSSFSMQFLRLRTPQFGVFVIAGLLGNRVAPGSGNLAVAARLRGTIDDEAIHAVKQVAGELEHLFGGGGQLGGTGSGLLHQFAHLVHGADNGLRAGSLFLDGGVDLLGDFGEAVGSLGNLRGADGLFVCGGADFLRELVDFGDDVGDFVQGAAKVIAEVEPFLDDARAVFHVLNRLASFALDALNEVGDFLGRLRGFFGQLADFVSDDREAKAVLPGAGGFDGRIQREKVGLFGEVINDLDDLADIVGAVAKNVDDFRGRLDGAI